jgi:hypothetical protein
MFTGLYATIRRTRGLILIAFLAVILALPASAAPTGSGLMAFRAQLSGANEVPPVETPASGQAVFTLSEDMTTLYYRIMVEDIADITMAHIHRGGPDENGPVVHWLYDATGTNAPDGPFDPDNPISGSITLSADDLADLQAGNFYVNVHTAANPPGEIRGQIEAFTPTANFNAVLAGSNEVPPVDTNASGVALFGLNSDMNMLHYEIAVANISGIFMAHIHRGWPDENGPVVHWLYDATGANAPDGPFDPENPIGGDLTLNAENLLDLLTGYYYVNVHTTTYRPGEIRGQIMAAAEGAPAGRSSITVRVFMDYRCDSFFTAGADRALADVPVTLTFSNGATVTKNTSAAGLATFSGLGVADLMAVSVDLPDNFFGRALGPCSGSSTVTSLSGADFGPFNSRFIVFRAEPKHEVGGP